MTISCWWDLNPYHLKTDALLELQQHNDFFVSMQSKYVSIHSKFASIKSKYVVDDNYVAIATLVNIDSDDGDNYVAIATLLNIDGDDDDNYPPHSASHSQSSHWSQSPSLPSTTIIANPWSFIIIKNNYQQTILHLLHHMMLLMWLVMMLDLWLDHELDRWWHLVMLLMLLMW